MHVQCRALIVATGLALAVAAGSANAQTSAADKSSNMGQPDASAAGASNGVGTSGSLTHDNGHATSTVSGVGGGTTGFGSADKGSVTKPPAESDPAIGARKSPQ